MLLGFYEVVTNIATPVSHDYSFFLRDDFNPWAIPQLEGLVSVMYWAMVFIDPELLIPKDMPPIPNIVDFALHLYPAMFLWSDFLIFNADFKRSPRHVALIYACAALYLAWSWYCQTKNGYWPYPFLDQLDTVPRVLFYLFCGTLCWIIYEAGASHPQQPRPHVCKHCMHAFLRFLQANREDRCFCTFMYPCSGQVSGDGKEAPIDRFIYLVL